MENNYRAPADYEKPGKITLHKAVTDGLVGAEVADQSFLPVDEAANVTFFGSRQDAAPRQQDERISDQGSVYVDPAALEPVPRHPEIGDTNNPNELFPRDADDDYDRDAVDTLDPIGAPRDVRMSDDLPRPDVRPRPVTFLQRVSSLFR